MIHEWIDEKAVRTLCDGYSRVCEWIDLELAELDNRPTHRTIGDAADTRAALTSIRDELRRQWVALAKVRDLARPS